MSFYIFLWKIVKTIPLSQKNTQNNLKYIIVCEERDIAVPYPTNCCEKQDLYFLFV